MQSSHVSCRRLQFRASASVLTEESQIFLDAYSSFSIVTSPDALTCMKIYDHLFVLANYFCLLTWSNLSISVKKNLLREILQSLYHLENKSGNHLAMIKFCMILHGPASECHV